MSQGVLSRLIQAQSAGVPLTDRIEHRVFDMKKAGSVFVLGCHGHFHPPKTLGSRTRSFVRLHSYEALQAQRPNTHSPYLNQGIGEWARTPTKGSAHG